MAQTVFSLLVTVLVKNKAIEFFKYFFTTLFPLTLFALQDLRYVGGIQYSDDEFITSTGRSRIFWHMVLPDS